MSEVPGAKNLAAQVVAAVGDVAHPGEAVLVVIIFFIGLVEERDTIFHRAAQLAHLVLVFILHHAADVGLGMAQDVGHTRAGKAVEDAALAHVDDGVAADGAEETATVQKLTIGHQGAVIRVCLGHTVIVTFQIHIAAVGRVVGVVLAVEFIIRGKHRFTFVLP